MRRWICLGLCICLITCSAIAEPRFTKDGCLVEKKYYAWAAIPALAAACGAIYLAYHPTIRRDKGLVWITTSSGMTFTSSGIHRDYAPAVILGFVSAFLTLITITPKKTYWVPKIDNDGTVHFEKTIRF